jgi:hypothetical protein
MYQATEQQPVLDQDGGAPMTTVACDKKLAESDLY